MSALSSLTLPPQPGRMRMPLSSRSSQALAGVKGWSGARRSLLDGYEQRWAYRAECGSNLTNRSRPLGE